MAYEPPDREFRNSLDVVRDAFALLVTGTHPVQLDGRLFDHLPDRLLALDEVRDRLLARSCPQATRDQVWASLVRRSREQGSTWTVGATGVALPALTAIAATLSARFVGDPSDIADEVLVGFLTALTSIDLERPRIMLRLRWSAYRAGHEALMAALAGPVPVDPGRLPAEPLVPVGHPDLVLARAVADGVLTAAEAELIGATRLDKTPLGKWAEEHGPSRWATYKARERAEKRLARHLRGGITVEKPSAEKSKKVPGVGVQECGTRSHDARTPEVPPCA
ncbi:hypothetical protein [Kutzneria sp. NPDC051319]|uniref:hypothetical protein n=1 Tax=Kutzneria sp. NPDC051319 TaxID=3155047 RepID=UPI003444C6A2